LSTDTSVIKFDEDPKLLTDRQTNKQKDQSRIKDVINEKDKQLLIHIIYG